MPQQETIIADTIMELFNDLVRMPVAGPGGQQATVHVPYWINLQTDEFAGPGGKRQRALNNHPAVKRLLNQNFNVLVAKGTPDQIARVVDTALDQGLIDPVTGPGLENWMRTFGVGLDCSGFVYQALDRLNPALRNAGLPGMSQPFDQHKTQDQIGFVSAANIAQRGIAVPVQDLRPGDTLHLFGRVDHVRILTDVTYDGTTVTFRTAESTDADPPAGAEHGIGPRLMAWRGTFTQTGSGFASLRSSRIGEPFPTSNERPVFARHLFWPMAPGQQAVLTQDGKIHTDPGLSTPTQFVLLGGTRVTLVDGPQQVDGRDWWQVDDGDGQVGWCSARLLRPA